MTNTMDIPATVTRLRRTFDSGITKPLEWRHEQLRGMRRMLVERAAEFDLALSEDLGKHPIESKLTETGMAVGEIDHTLRHLKRWLAPRHRGVPLMLQPASAKVMLEPLGVVLVIAPWNYPVLLSLTPLIGALAAGNVAILKPSELAVSTSVLLARLLPKYLDPNAIAVVEGGVDETTLLLEQRFDHIFYTGNGRVGRVVMTAAAKHLTPVTLELGGKSPVWVDDSVDLAAAARRIAWGKFINCGQTCVAPDYLLAAPAVADKLAPLLARAIVEMYGATPATSHDYGRIVNVRQFHRLATLLDEGRVVAGGQTDEAQRYIAPTVLDHVAPDAWLMRDEIFGPILPIVRVPDLDAALAHIRAGDKPLALYAFTDDTATRKRFEDETSSGAIGFNVVVAHLGAPDLPFGGVGPSGIGAYHGRRSVETFSHEKPVLKKPLRPDTLRLVMPPYGKAAERIIRWMMKR
ncbi:MAG: aldehyde dehydrogenase family protein [Gammaproteobacteria bacterium]|nr:aldehyde dehydrogenase family protein [Gammaproteobacteria bacterium]MBU1416430.1 aldehyde dehydrogenase family protein [Gammaproteobacteria bacterium]